MCQTLYNNNMVILPFINPIKYTKLTPDEIPQYVSRHYDDWPFADTIQPWEQEAFFCQPWQYSDSIRQQIQSDVGPVRIRIYDAQGGLWYDDNFQQMQQSLNMPEMFIHQSDIALNIITQPGVYYIRLDAGINSWVSEFLYISQTIENTLHLAFSNSKFYGDTLFETGYQPSIRIYGRLKPKAPQARDTIYEDQILNSTILDSKPYRLFELQLSAPTGIPPYFINKLNWILGCSNLQIDGRYYTKNEGSKLEEVSFPNYPMSGYTIEMREKLNRSSELYETGSPITGVAVVVANTDSKGFGQDDSGGSVYQILDVN